MTVLWLRFLTEIAEDTIEAPTELLENEATRKALGLVEKSAMTEGQLYAYEKFWLAVVDERILREAATKKGYNEGWEKGNKEGMEKGHIEDARRMKADNMATELIAKYTGLTIEEIEALT
jgi:predicted transposase/invertase (TIGR01784 family)